MRLPQVAGDRIQSRAGAGQPRPDRRFDQSLQIEGGVVVVALAVLNGLHVPQCAADPTPSGHPILRVARTMMRRRNPVPVDRIGA